MLFTFFYTSISNILADLADFGTSFTLNFRKAFYMNTTWTLFERQFERQFER